MLVPSRPPARLKTAKACRKFAFTSIIGNAPRPPQARLTSPCSVERSPVELRGQFQTSKKMITSPASIRRAPKSTRTAVVLAALMCAVSAVGLAARPTVKASRTGNVITLETAVPKAFAGWTLANQTSLIVNPQAEQALFGLYSQVLTRTYVDQDGYRVMLSVAYNDDQRGGLQTHRPEVCYPAQGFTLDTTDDGELPTNFGSIPVRRLTTSLEARKEPVTYWLTVG